MKINSTKMMMMSIIMLTTLTTMSSNSMLFSWMMMEINMISFLPMISESNKMKDQIMKFFIVQSMASSILLMSMLMNSINETPISNSIMLMTSFMVKTGFMPFHSWMPPMMNSMSWNNCMIMTTIQKLIPMIMFTQMSSTKITILPMIMSLVMAPISAMKQLSMKKIMSFSSISNNPWMFYSMTNSKSQFMLFFTIYSTMNLMIMKTLKKMNIQFINQMMTMSLKNKLNLLMNMISMSGIPPMMGFLPKWMILQTTMQTSLTIAISMVSSSMISTFIYLKIISTTLMINSTTKKSKKKYTEMINLNILVNILGLPIMLTMKSM